MFVEDVSSQHINLHLTGADFVYNLRAAAGEDSTTAAGIVQEQAVFHLIYKRKSADEITRQTTKKPINHKYG